MDGCTLDAAERLRALDDARAHEQALLATMEATDAEDGDPVYVLGAAVGRPSPA